MTEEIPESLFQKYHVALVKALGEDAQKIFVKLGRELGSKITNKEKISLKELEAELENYLQNDLKLRKSESKHRKQLFER